MKNIIFQKIKEQYLSVIYYAIGLLAYTWLMIGMFPSMKSFDIDSYIKQMPEEMIKFFGGDLGMQYSKIEGFLSIEYLSIFFVLIILFYIGSSIGSAIAGNLENRTLDFDLSQPISRSRYLLSHIIVTILYTTLLVGFNVFAIYVLCRGYGVIINNAGLLSFTLVASMFFLAMIGIATFLTSISKTRVTVILVTVFFSLGSYLFLSLSNIFDKLKNYKAVSIYNLYEPQKVLETGEINWSHLAILALIFLIGTVLSLLIFNKKDL